MSSVLPLDTTTKYYRSFRLLLSYYERSFLLSSFIPLELLHLIYRYYQLFFNTTILSATEQIDLLNLLKSELKIKNTKYPKLELLLNAKKQGFSNSIFHKLCDKKGPTITIVQISQNHICGGYASESWQSSPRKYTKAKDSFLFVSRIGNESVKLKYDKLLNDYKLPIKLGLGNESDGWALRLDESRGPAFGGGHDLYICDYSNLTKEEYEKLDKNLRPLGRSAGHSYSSLGNSYVTKVGKYSVDSQLLVGDKTHGFIVLNYEVFKVSNN